MGRFDYVRRGKRTMAMLGVMAVLGASLAFAASAGADDPIPVAADGNESGNVHSEPAGDRSIAEAWTTERMSAAAPIIVEGVSGQARAETADDAPIGEPGAVLGGRPGDSEARLNTAANVEPTGSLLTRGYKYPAPYTGFFVAIGEHKKYPRRTVGAMFFTYKGGDYRCSASSIGNYAIYTAGHCVHDGSGKQNGWSDDIIFVPSYNGNKPCPGQGCPFGVWEYDHSWVKTSWYNNMNYSEDWGGVVLKKSGGKKISQKVGWLGFAWNWPANQHWNLFGYPAAPPFNGNRMATCQASLAYRVPGGTGAKMVGVGCNMTGGSSGGPWILGYGNDNFLNGINSSHRNNKDIEMLSSFFNNSAESLWQDLIDSAPGNPA